LWIALGLPAASARAQGERPLIVLLLPERDSPTTRRLIAESAELRAGVRVLRAAPGVDTSGAGLAELAEQQDAAAVVLLADDERAATVWFRDAETGATERRLVKGGSGSAAVRTDAVVVGTMEVLRARLLEKPAPPPAKPESQPRKEPSPPANTEEHHGPLVLGAVIGLDQGGPDFTFSSSFQLNADVVLHESLRLRGLMRVPMASARATDGSASAEVKPLLAAGAFAVGGELARAWWLDFYVGAGGTHVIAEGFSEVPASTRSVDRWVFVVIAGVHTAWRLNSVMSLTLQAGAALAPSPVEIYVNDQRIATWGRPAVMTGVGLEFQPTLF
jgi:hypothetical protein